MRPALYFAYGSNLDTLDWHRWCGEHGHAAGLLRFRTRAYLPDYELAFDISSDVRHGGVLNLASRPGQLVSGALFDVTDAAWRALDEKEGAPEFYRTLPCHVFDDEGHKFAAHTYQVPARLTTGHAAPHADYASIVRRGLAALDLPGTMLQAAAQGVPAPWSLRGLFCYGTLMRGECRFRHLEPFGIREILPARARGRLFHLGSYPGMTEPATDQDWVTGEWIELEDWGQAVQSLDVVETFVGYDQPGSDYERVRVPVEMADGSIRPAWTYRYVGTLERAWPLPGGDWRAESR